VALIFTFPCGRCGKKYSIYYPKTFIYSVYGTGTPAQGQREDAEEQASGAIAAARDHAEASGNTWINAGEVSKITCVCGKNLDLNVANHPRVPQRKAEKVVRQTGVIAFPTITKAPRGPAVPDQEPAPKHGPGAATPSDTGSSAEPHRRPGA
jgi:hypothetical protein